MADELPYPPIDVPGNPDWTWDDVANVLLTDSETRIFAQKNNTTGVQTSGHVQIDTSGIGSDTIVSGNLYYYHGSYSKSTEVGYHRGINLNGTTIFNSTDTPPASGWVTLALTPAQLALINKTGFTMVIFWVADPGGAYLRIWAVRAKEFAPTGTYMAHLDLVTSAGVTVGCILGV